MAIRFFDMFAGIGGFRSGLEAVGGFECIGHCEIDKKANQAYNAIYQPKGEIYFEDATKIDTNDLPDIDLICAGFPCQSFSVAGKRLGFRDDTRGTLFFEVARIAEAKRPPLLLLENVPGLLSHDGGRTLFTIFSTLVELGYDIEWCVHNSAFFGVPQQRRRLYIVGYLGNQCTGELFPLNSGNAEDLKQLIPGPQGQRVYDPSGSACTQCAGSGGWGGKTGLYFIDMNPDPVITDHARCITARQDSGVSNRRGEHSAVLITGAKTVDESDPKMVLTAKDGNGIEYCGRVRRLIPHECFRLQGFTDEQFEKILWAGIPEAQLYKLAGNSVTTNVVTAVAKKLIEEINKLEVANAESCNEPTGI